MLERQAISAKSVLAALASGLVLAACASGPDEPSGPPTVLAAPGLPAPPQARFYANCIAAAAAAGTYDRESDADVLRFTCTGTPARVFYDGLAAWSAEIDSQITAEGRTWRFSQKLQQNPFGIDYCSVAGTTDHRCVVVLNVGEFLNK